MDSLAYPEDIDVDKDVETQGAETDNDLRSPGSQAKRKAGPGKSEATSQPSKTSKKELKPRSHVWEHYTRAKDNKDKCKCHYCGRILAYPTSSGTSNLQKHLNSCKQYKVWQDSQSQQIIANDGNNLKLAKVSESVFKEATNEMLVLGELPLAFVESVAWRHCCSKINLYDHHSRRTATREIVEMFMQRRAVMKNWFATNKQRVSLTTDIWVAQTTGVSYMVIIAHFVDSNWNLRKMIIGFKYVTDHKGATIASTLLACLAEGGIEKLFTITTDNATANSSALRKFERDFKLLGNEALVLNGEFLHMRCAAHIINLIARDGLYAVDANVSAIRNAVLYVRSSTPRLESFDQRVLSRKMTRGSLPLDVKTKWNSTYLMLTKAMEFKLAFDRMEAENKFYNEYFTEFEYGKKGSDHLHQQIGVRSKSWCGFSSFSTTLL